MSENFDDLFPFLERRWKEIPPQAAIVEARMLAGFDLLKAVVNRAWHSTHRLELQLVPIASATASEPSLDGPEIETMADITKAADVFKAEAERLDAEADTLEVELDALKRSEKKLAASIKQLRRDSAEMARRAA